MSDRLSATRDRWVERFTEVVDDLPGAALLGARRQHAIERFAEVGLPTTKDEDWRFTPIRPITAIDPRPVTTPGAVPDAATAGALGTPGLDGRRLVFVDGCFAPTLSQIPAIEGGHVGPLGALLDAAPGWLEKHLGQIADAENKPFNALNLAFFTDGAAIQVPRGTVVDGPIELLFLATGGDQPSAHHTRNVIVCDETSELHVIETHASLGAGVTLGNVVTEIAAAPGAVVQHSKVQRLGEDALQVSDVAARLDRDSRVTQRSFSVGARLFRQDVGLEQTATGVEMVLDGLFLADSGQHVDHHTSLDHAKPHGQSRELYKGILDGDAVGVFDGKVDVAKDAQKTDSRQYNRNLLLSRDAVIETKPQLEILADDVKCAHGATIGHLDDTALFYLRSRGLDARSARSVLIYAFASEVIDRVPDDGLRQRLHDLVLTRLPGGDHLATEGL